MLFVKICKAQCNLHDKRLFFQTALLLQDVMKHLTVHIVLVISVIRQRVNNSAVENYKDF